MASTQFVLKYCGQKSNNIASLALFEQFGTFNSKGCTPPEGLVPRLQSESLFILQITVTFFSLKSLC
jgi:hypothetical protein